MKGRMGGGGTEVQDWVSGSDACSRLRINSEGEIEKINWRDPMARSVRDPCDPRICLVHSSRVPPLCFDAATVRGISTRISTWVLLW